MVMQERGFWRVFIAFGLAMAAAGIAGALSLVWALVRRNVSPAVPATAAVSVGVTAWLIDWYSERHP